MSSELNPKIAAQQWLAIIVLGLISIVLGAGLGFISQAMVPVQTFPVLPKPNPKKPDENPLPKVYWLKQYTSKSVGNARAKEKALKEYLPQTDLSDREIGQWLNRVFGNSEEIKEDLDAQLGIPFVRIGGQAPGADKDPVLTVTMPFKLKVLTLPVSEVPLQFVARPVYDGGVTTWVISDVRVGHARVPDSIARSTVIQAVNEVIASKKPAGELWDVLAAYRRMVIRDNKLWMESPVKPTAAPAEKPAETTATPVAARGKKPAKVS